MSESTSSSIMGSVLKQTQDREGVHIDTPHGWVINDVHHAWTKNETYHWETGNIFHMTSGQVLHVNLNTVEVHATANVLTMHVDITPLNVHIIPLPIGIDVHIEVSHLRKHVNIHGGHHHQLVSEFHQESQAVHIESTKKAQSLSDKAADLLAHGPDAKHLGTMNLEAEGDMTLQSKEDAVYISAKKNLQMESEDSARLLGNTTCINSEIRTSLQIANKDMIWFDKDELNLKNEYGVSIRLGGTNLTTNATKTELNGTVEIGQPVITGMATTAGLDKVWDELEYGDQELTRLRDTVYRMKRLLRV